MELICPDIWLMETPRLMLPLYMPALGCEYCDWYTLQQRKVSQRKHSHTSNTLTQGFYLLLVEMLAGCDQPFRSVLGW